MSIAQVWPLHAVATLPAILWVALRIRCHPLPTWSGWVVAGLAMSVVGDLVTLGARMLGGSGWDAVPWIVPAQSAMILVPFARARWTWPVVLLATALLIAVPAWRPMPSLAVVVAGSWLVALVAVGARVWTPLRRAVLVYALATGLLGVTWLVLFATGDLGNILLGYLLYQGSRAVGILFVLHALTRVEPMGRA